MKIQYEMDYEDVAAFWTWVRRKDVKKRKKQILFHVFSFWAMMTLALGILIGREHSFSWPFLLTSGLLSLLFSFFYRLTLTRPKITAKQIANRMPAKENARLLGPQTLELTETALVGHSSLSEGSTHYRGLWLEESDTHIYIFVSTDMAHVIAKNKIEPVQLDAFIKELKIHLAEANPVLPTTQNI